MNEQTNTSEKPQPQKTPTATPRHKDDWSAKTLAIDFLTCFVAALLVSASLYYFSNYNGFAPGGVTGVASMLASLTAKSFGEVTANMSLFMFALNLPIFTLVAVFVSRKTGFILIVYMLFQSGLMMFFKWLHSEFSVPYYGALENGGCYEEGNNLVFAAIGVGVISGLGFSLMLRRFGASGGTYAISALIKHFHPEKSIAWVAFVLDSSVVVLAFFVYQSGANSVVSTLANIFISDLVVDYMLQGLRSGYKFEIITDRAEELAAELMHRLGRGVTTIHAEGMYTHHDKTILICIIRKRQVGEFLKILKNYQGSTFSYSCRVNEVYGKFENTPAHAHAEEKK